MYLKLLSSPFTDLFGKTLNEIEVWARRTNQDVSLLIKNISFSAFNLHVFELKSRGILSLKQTIDCRNCWNDKILLLFFRFFLFCFPKLSSLLHSGLVEFANINLFKLATVNIKLCDSFLESTHKNIYRNSKHPRAQHWHRNTLESEFARFRKNLCNYLLKLTLTVSFLIVA